jgi:hypothetical protein
MQATAADTGQTLGVDHLLNARQVLGQRPAIDRSGPDGPLGSRSIGFLFCMDDGDRRLQIL